MTTLELLRKNQEMLKGFSLAASFQPSGRAAEVIISKQSISTAKPIPEIDPITESLNELSKFMENFTTDFS